MKEPRYHPIHPGDRAAAEPARAAWATIRERRARVRKGAAACAEARPENGPHAGPQRPRGPTLQPAHPAKTITVEQARAAFLEVAAERRQARLARRKARERAAARARLEASRKC